MQIKWLDQRTNGIGDYSKWLPISQTRALEMLKRNDPKEYETRVWYLSMGKEIVTKTYALRGQDGDKFDI